MNCITEDVCRYITEEYRNSVREVQYENVLDRFSHLITTDILYEKYKDLIGDVYMKNVSKNEIKYLVESVLFSKINEGFYNPFHDIICNELDNKDAFIDVVPETKYKYKNGEEIKNIKIWDSNVNGKIICKNGSMYSGINFIKGDVVEECPIKMLNASDMYSKNIRDISFEIEDGIYALPYGYANCYKTTYDTDKEPNIDYTYIRGDGFIKFYAIKRIRPNEELILKAYEEAPMENIIKNKQFNYTSGIDPIYISKIESTPK